MKAPLLTIEDATHPILLKRWHVFAAQSVPAGVLLAQIIYWNSPKENGGSRLRVKKLGRWWVAKSYEEWSNETGLSEKQVRYAIDGLMQIGLINIKRMRFDGRPVVHVSLNIPVVERLFHAFLRLLQKGRIDYDKRSESDSYKRAESITETTRTETTTETLQQRAKKTAPANTWEHSKMKANEALEKFMQKHKPAKGFPDSMPVTSTLQLTVLWERIVPYYHDLDTSFKALTRKEAGMLGHFRKAVGNQNAYAIMKWTVEHWTNFLVDIADKVGDTLSSKQPQVGVLLKYRHVAEAGWKGQGAPTKKPKGGFLSKEAKAALTK